MIRTFMLRFLQRSDALRYLLLPVIFGIFTILILGIASLTQGKPKLESLSPSIAESGEVIVLTGKNFGEKRGDKWIEIGGNRISESSFIQWTDSTIMILLSTAVDDGLVYVVNGNVKSNPLIFANKSNIPVEAKIDRDLGLPEILSVSASALETGKRLTIYGKNFGITKNKSIVLFSWQIDQAIPLSGISLTSQSSIACSEHDFDYELWSDMELCIRIPDGAVSGNMYVKTEQGFSNPMPIQILAQAGFKTYVDKHTYVISLEVDITGVSASEGNMLFLRIPVPEITASQRSVEVTLSTPKPYMENYHGVILHQLENLKTGKNEKIAHSYLLTNYGIVSSVNVPSVKPYADTESPLYLMYTSADRIVPSDGQEIIQTAASIVGKENNPYKKAKLIYSWIGDNIKNAALKNPDRSVITALSEKSGDAYDKAILFSALARASGIPTIPVAGILVDSSQTSRTHWWAESYIEGFGWLPVDPDLGGENHFGNMDSYHIAFSRGWADAKPMTPKSKIVFKNRSFAFQPIWEEAGGNIKAYTSFWAEPRITGAY